MAGTVSAAHTAETNRMPSRLSPMSKELKRARRKYRGGCCGAFLARLRTVPRQDDPGLAC